LQDGLFKQLRKLLKTIVDEADITMIFLREMTAYIGKKKFMITLFRGLRSSKTEKKNFALS
jgi:hypothetical protein